MLWGPKHFSTLKHAYRDAGFFSSSAGELKKILESPWGRLADLTWATLGFSRDAFGITTQLVR